MALLDQELADREGDLRVKIYYWPDFIVGTKLKRTPQGAAFQQQQVVFVYLVEVQVERSIAVLGLIGPFREVPKMAEVGLVLDDLPEAA